MCFFFLPHLTCHELTQVEATPHCHWGVLVWARSSQFCRVLPVDLCFSRTPEEGTWRELGRQGFGCHISFSHSCFLGLAGDRA